MGREQRLPATYTTIATNGTGGGNGQCYVYDGCPADGQVELCTFDAMDHCWAGGATAGAAGNCVSDLRERDAAPVELLQAVRVVAQCEQSAAVAPRCDAFHALV